MKRKAQLEDLGLEAEEAEATLLEFEDADDDTFDKVRCCYDDHEKEGQAQA